MNYRIQRQFPLINSREKKNPLWRISPPKRKTKNLRVFSFLFCIKTKNPPNPLVKGDSHLCCHLELTIEGYFFYIKSQKNLNSKKIS